MSLALAARQSVASRHDMSPSAGQSCMRSGFDRGSDLRWIVGSDLRWIVALLWLNGTVKRQHARYDTEVCGGERLAYLRWLSSVRDRS